MSELPDTPILARYYCPGCQPEADPLAEILEIRWCAACAHLGVPVAGSEDACVTAVGWLSGSGEVGGTDNKAWCSLLHRGRK